MKVLEIKPTDIDSGGCHDNASTVQYNDLCQCAKLRWSIVTTRDRSFRDTVVPTLCTLPTNLHNYTKQSVTFGQMQDRQLGTVQGNNRDRFGPGLVHTLLSLLTGASNLHATAP
jgi:hypothetical protein